MTGQILHVWELGGGAWPKVRVGSQGRIGEAAPKSSFSEIKLEVSVEIQKQSFRSH